MDKILTEVIFNIKEIVERIYAPLFDNSIISIKWFPFFLKKSCEIYYRYKITPDNEPLEISKEPICSLQTLEERKSK